MTETPDPDECLAWAQRLAPGDTWSTCGDYVISYDAVSQLWYCMRFVGRSAIQAGLEYSSTSFSEAKAWLIAVILTGA
jgi:hypothetical protein